MQHNLLHVLETQTAKLEAELETYKEDRAAENIAVTTVVVDAADPVETVVKKIYERIDPTIDYIFPFGDIPQPLAGPVDYNGHGGGRYPCDWVFQFNNWPARVDNYVPYYPVTYLPESPRIKMGRVTLNRLSAFKKSPIELYRDYLNRRHDFTITQGANYGVGIPVYNAFGDYNSMQAILSNNLNGAVGSNFWWNWEGANYQFFPWLADNPHLMAFAYAPGNDWSRTEISGSAAIAAKPPKVPIMIIRSSFVDDDQSNDSYMRSLIAGNCLAVLWNYFTELDINALASGKTVGEVTLTPAQNFRMLTRCIGDPTMNIPFQSLAQIAQNLATLQASFNDLSSYVKVLNTKVESGPALVNSDPSTVTKVTSGAFVKIDTTTQGNYANTYGKEGVYIPGRKNNLPSYVNFSRVSGASYDWNGNDNRALLLSDNTRAAVCDFDGTNESLKSNFSYSLEFADEVSHQVAFYCLDWDHANRNQTLQIFDANTNQQLSSQAVVDFSQGKWFVYNLTGKVRVVFTNIDSVNAVCSMVAFGGAN